MEIKEEKVDDSVQETDELLDDARQEEYPSSGESTMTCSTLSSLVSLPALESLSDSAPDLPQPDTKSNQCSAKRSKRGRRERKPKQLPKTSRLDDYSLKEEAMENKDSGKRLKILLPQKVRSGTINLNPNITNLEIPFSESRFTDGVYDTISALPNLNSGKSINKNVITSVNTSKNPAEDNYYDQYINKDSDSGLSDKESPVVSSVEAEISFEKQVSELCKDIKKTNLGSRNREGNVSIMPSTSSKATFMEVVSIPPNLHEITSGSAGNSEFLDTAGPSTSHDKHVTDFSSEQSMRGKIALAERRKRMLRKRRNTVVTKGLGASMKRKVVKLTDEIDQINAVLAKEIEKKGEYYKKGYKIAHQILEDLEKEGHN